MTSLAHAIQSFQRGRLPPGEFLAQIDQALAADQGGSAHLLELLNDEHTRVQLPPDIYAELRSRAERALLARRRYGATETRAAAGHDDRLTSPSARTDGGAFGNAPELVLPERMKGVGDTLNGRFVLEECIGFGGMGTVYKALDLRKLEAADRKPYVAIKVLNVQFRGHPKSLIALQREARKAQTLAHPNIVAVYDFDRDGSTVYLTMEYLAGKPLSGMLKAPGFAGLPVAEALRIAGEMGKALAYAHERGFVHCDFKPANVILTDAGQIKVIDFGIARVFHKPDEEMEATVFDPGSLGALTPAYASAEMLEHRVPDPRDDIYALACITYELLTGRHPFDRLPATQARGAGMKPQRPKNLSHAQWRALRHALAFEREARTLSVARFLQEMRGERLVARYAAMAAVLVALAVLLAAGLERLGTMEISSGESSSADGSGAAGSGASPVTPAKAPELTLASVTPVLSGIPCSALVPAVNAQSLQVQGYLPASFGAARLEKLLNAIPGVKVLNLNVQQVGDQDCGVISAFASYWAANRQAGSPASISTKGAATELKDGDPLILDIGTPAYDSFVYVDYYVLDGSVAHLLPSPRARAHQAPPNHRATIGSLGNWVISKPFGKELIVLIVTPAPLFDGLRPVSEPRADYLRAVEQRLGQLTAKYGRDKIAVDFVQITTHARKP